MTEEHRRLRVLFMIDRGGELGGAERFVTGLAMHMPRDRVDPWVCSTRQGNEKAIRLLGEAGIPHINLNRRAKWDVHRFRHLVAIIRRERFDVLHAHKFGSNIWGTLIGSRYKVPVVIAHEHNWSYSGNPLRVWLDRRVISPRATKFVTVSASSRTRMIDLEGIDPEKILVMPTAYIPHENSSSEDVRAEMGLDATTRLIGVAAGLREEKALGVMLDAHRLVRDRGLDAHLVLAGDGPCRPELESQADSLGLSAYVHFLGWRRDVDSILRASDVGAMSSDWEGMPLFVFECMAAQTPLVATAVGGIPEIVEDGVTGLLVPLRDPPALADALARVLSDHALGERLANAASERLHGFQIDQVASSFADLYEQLVAESIESVG